MNIDFEIENLSYLSPNASQFSKTEDRFANLRENKHPNVYVESPVLKGGFFCILGVFSMVMDSQEGEMTPGKKIGSKYSIVMKI